MNWYLDVLKNYVNFNGRARRKEYWMFFLFHIIIYYGLIAISLIISHKLFPLAIIYIFATMLPAFGVGVRRMHDVGKSGWYLFIPIYSFILAVTEGEQGQNDYGSDPKNTNDEMDQIGSQNGF